MIDRDHWLADLGTGRIFLACRCRDLDKPQAKILYWPTLDSAADTLRYLAEYGKTLADTEIWNGRNARDYNWRIVGHSQWMPLRLTNGGQTQAERVETEEIPCPKVRAGIPTRFRAGRWEKCLKTGWTTA